jgi:hypothetical protein
MRANGSLGHGDTRVPKDGEVLRHFGWIELCESGLHASRSPLDALRWAPGPMICRVECGGETLHGRDKLVCAERTILWRADATDVLQRFARLCALDVSHLWDMPPVMKRYLRTGDETIKNAARDAAAGEFRDAPVYCAWVATVWNDAPWTAIPQRVWRIAEAAAKSSGFGSRSGTKATQTKRLHRMLMELGRAKR